MESIIKNVRRIFSFRGAVIFGVVIGIITLGFIILKVFDDQNKFSNGFLRSIKPVLLSNDLETPLAENVPPIFHITTPRLSTTEAYSTALNNFINTNNALGFFYNTHLHPILLELQRMINASAYDVSFFQTVERMQIMNAEQKRLILLSNTAFRVLTDETRFITNHAIREKTETVLISGRDTIDQFSLLTNFLSTPLQGMPPATSLVLKIKEAADGVARSSDDFIIAIQRLDNAIEIEITAETRRLPNQ